LLIIFATILNLQKQDGHQEVKDTISKGHRMLCSVSKI